jgi:hypothetical protein
MIYTAPYVIILMRANQLRGQVGGDWALDWARCHFRARKSLDFQDPPLLIALVMDLARIKKSLRPATYKQQVH